MHRSRCLAYPITLARERPRLRREMRQVGLGYLVYLVCLVGSIGEPHRKVQEKGQGTAEDDGASPRAATILSYVREPIRR
jgi:hypothetical protein